MSGCDEGLMRYYPAGCPCYACDAPTWEPLYPGGPTFRNRMSLCPTCGNKRCPGAANHENTCTGSNAYGQPGSLYRDATPDERAEWDALIASLDGDQ